MTRQLFVFIFLILFFLFGFSINLQAQENQQTQSEISTEAPEPTPTTPPPPELIVPPTPTPTPPPIQQGPLPQIQIEEGPETVDPSRPSTMPFGPWKTDWERYQKSKAYDPQWDSLVREGLKAYGERHLEATYTFLSQAVDKGCRDGIVFYYLARQQQEVQNMEAAIRYYILSWIVIADQYPGLHYRARISSELGQFFFAQQRFDKTIQFCQPIVDQFPGEYELMYLVAVSYFQLGQYGSAIHYFEKIIATHPDHIQSRQLASLASVEIAKVYCARGQNQECQAYLYKALFFEPNNQVAKTMIQQYSKQQGQGPGGASSEDANKMLHEFLKK